jgi:hypothetical protein
MFEKQYDDVLKQGLDVMAADKIAEGETLTRPDRLPEKVWTGLNDTQRWRRVLEIRQRSAAGKIKNLLTDTDRLIMAYGDRNLTPDDIATLQCFLDNSICNNGNPTWDSLVDYVVEKRTSGEPMELALSLCIDSDPELNRRGAAKFFAQESASIPNSLRSQPVDRFVRGCLNLEDTKRKLRPLLAGLPASTVLTVRLGDMDFWTVNEVDQCLLPEELAALQEQVAALRAEVQADMDTSFGPEKVCVRQWSDDSGYSLDTFRAEQVKAEGDQEWLTPQLLGQSLYEFVQFWEANGLTAERYIEQDRRFERWARSRIIRIAAQYRTEADLIPGIQLWSERAGNPLWSLRISDYDGKGLPPSLILTA